MKKSLRVNSFYFYLPAVIAIIFTLMPWYSEYLRDSASTYATEDAVRALHLAERSVQMDSLSVKSLYVLADTQQRLGREVEARNSLLKAIKLQPMNYATWELLAKYERDLWDEQNLAQQHFVIALELNPYDKQLRKEISKQ